MQNNLFDTTKCKLCPVECGADREKYAGYCSTSSLKIAKYYLHPFEEPCISYKNGSGTVFFCGCNLRCVFCQNFEVSRNLTGKSITVQELADIFAELEKMGADNINLVNPSHLVPYIVEAFKLYRPKIPVVYNSSGYEKVESLKLIDEYIDIYLPDMKFYASDVSAMYTKRDNYFSVASNAIEFMANKPLKFENGKMLSGTIIRHLILPLCSNDSIEILKWYSKHMATRAYLSLMCQYTPFGEIENFPELKRKITKREYEKVVDFALTLGLENVFIQDKNSAESKFIPHWDF